MVETVSEIDSRFSRQISALLSAPDLLQLQAYFEALVADRRCNGLEVKLDSKNGKGVYCKVNFEEGDLILKDKMLVGAQHCSNKFDCLVCSYCFQFIGSIELQIGRKLYFQELGLSVSDECGPSDESGCNSSVSKSCIPSDVIQSLMDGRMKLPFSDKFALPPVVPCPGGCGEAFYCSELCAEADWKAFHSLLCTGSSSRDKGALLEFLKHANETNDIFIPAAKLISFLILRFRELKAASHIEQQRKKHKSSNLQYNDIFHRLLEAWKPVSVGYKKSWWDCISLPEDIDPCDESLFRKEIKELAFESLQLLKHAIYDDECAPLFSLDIYGHIIGMFELNNLDLVVASPVEDYFLYIDDLPDSEKEEVQKITKPLVDALGDDFYSVPCQGTAFFPLQSCMNHSCAPNAKAFKREEDRNGEATIIATRSILAGEEITISYIDEDLPFEERQKLLADYGFHCKCPKCLADKP